MSESQDVQTTESVSFASFAAVYFGCEPFKVSTDGQEVYVATYYFHLPDADWTSLNEKFQSGQTVTNIKTFCDKVKHLQKLAEKCDRQGGILNL